MLATGMADPNLVPNANPNDVRNVVLGTLDHTLRSLQDGIDDGLN